MGVEYLIVDKSILPDYYGLVLKTKSLVDDEKQSVSEACRQTGISRSTFYKYKDKIFNTSAQYGKNAIVTLRLVDVPGVLSNVMQQLYERDANIVTVNSTLPIDSVSFVTIVFDTTYLKTDSSFLLKELRKIHGVKSAAIVAIE